MSTRDRWEPNTEAWFEYHCFESMESSDAVVWLRSHERVTVLGHLDNGAHDPCLRDALPTLAERGAEGCPCLYRVRFADGFEYDVFEDELLTAREDFYRPDPPSATVAA